MLTVYMNNERVSKKKTENLIICSYFENISITSTQNHTFLAYFENG